MENYMTTQNYDTELTTIQSFKDVSVETEKTRA